MPKRRASERDERDLSEEDEEQTQPPSQRRRRVEAEDDTSYGDELGGETEGDTNHEQLVKNLVRLALASEYTRLPIRRADINAKVLLSQSRQFKPVFAAAQQKLRHIFGMQMTELPLRDKVTIQQKRAAAKSQAETSKDSSRVQGHAKTSNAWILTTVLPDRYRTPAILTPSQVPTAELESQYTGLASFVVSIITLGGGSVQESKLERYMDRANVGDSTPFSNTVHFSALDRREKLLKKMEKDGFIVKVKETAGGDEVVEYVLGPRGKVEVGEEGVEGMVRAVYGDVDDQADLDRRLKRSLAYLHARPVQSAEAAG